ncbi:MAG: NAD+ kinase [Natronomonas sp.]|jgi:NAD+ kinase|uniref:ATP-NAD kinase n=1 Tax=Natronomonas sp. TaxID=2184060 RepID=UPI003989119C
MSGQRVGVVGDGRLAPAVEAAGGEPIGGPAEFGSVRFVAAAGEDAIVDVARSVPEVPVLAVGADPGLRAVPFDRLEAAIERALEGDSPTVQHPVVEAAGSIEPVRAVFDIALAAAEPARISEFAVHSGEDQVARFRADGVVASTPAGSAGYNHNAGGPVVASGTGVASVVPIAPFATSIDHWALPLDSVRLSVKRDETPVELLADGRRESTVDAGGPVTLSRVGSVETYALPESSGPF